MTVFAASTQVGFHYLLEFKNSLTDANWIPVQTKSGNGFRGSLSLFLRTSNIPVYSFVSFAIPG